MTDGQVRTLTIKEAAEALGITPIAVRRRLTRGKLPGHKDGRGQWWVLLSDTDLTREQAGHQPGAPGRDQPANGSATTGMTEVITTLKDEVRFLRRELDQRSEELRRKDFMLAEFARSIADLKSRLPELPATTPRTATLAEVDESSEPPRPAWWRRLLYGPNA